jgi:hypothetical protein
MFNTWGIRSINSSTFNQSRSLTLIYPKENRDIIITLFRVHNCVLDILGYIPAVSTVSGSVRMCTGLAICVVTLLKGNPDLQPGEQGAIAGAFYYEALATGVAQMTRGAFEAFVPFGRIINFSLGTIGTVVNLLIHEVNYIHREGGSRVNDPRTEQYKPHDEAPYIWAIPLQIV